MIYMPVPGSFALVRIARLFFAHTARPCQANTRLLPSAIPWMCLYTHTAAQGLFSTGVHWVYYSTPFFSCLAIPYTMNGSQRPLTALCSHSNRLPRWLSLAFRAVRIALSSSSCATTAVTLPGVGQESPACTAHPWAATGLPSVQCASLGHPLPAHLFRLTLLPTWDFYCWHARGYGRLYLVYPSTSRYTCPFRVPISVCLCQL